MGFQEKHEVEVSDNSEIWVITGISLLGPLRPAKAKMTEKGDEETMMMTTPTKKGGGGRLVCPPAPKKARPSLMCRLEGVEFFRVPEDLESVFVQRRERAK